MVEYKLEQPVKKMLECFSYMKLRRGRKIVVYKAFILNATLWCSVPSICMVPNPQ